MAAFNPDIHPHRRFNPLTNEYVLVSPHRNKRPWLGQTEATQDPQIPHYDSGCYLCPGNTRAGGQKNPVYDQTFTFVNDFAALSPESLSVAPPTSHPLLKTLPVHGTCDVVIFNPRHDLTLAQLSVDDIQSIIMEWIRIYQVRGAQEGIKYVQIFENKGAIMGCSNPHPHGQVWSLSEVPTLPSTEIASLRNYSLSQTATPGAPKGPKDRPCLLCEYAFVEITISEPENRVVLRNAHWVCLVPWWAVWPFEVLLLPYQRHISSITDLSGEETRALAEILQGITIKYDNLFSCSFAYSMGIHQRPVPRCENSSQDGDEDEIAHLHLHFCPPLLRSANIRKFLVGFEIAAEPQRDLTPELAAEKLRACSGVHYLKKDIE